MNATSARYIPSNIFDFDSSTSITSYKIFEKDLCLFLKCESKYCTPSPF